MQIPAGGLTPPIRLPERAPAARPSTAPAEPPAPSAEASLWEVLTPEERAFFRSRSELGPLTYGPHAAAAEPWTAPLGGRVDRRG